MESEPVLQSRLPYPPPDGRLPGIAPLALAEWLVTDEAFAGQMALRPEARDAADELLALVLGQLRGRAGYRVSAGHVRRPDGVEVALGRAGPLATLGRLVQEDFCLLLRPAGSGEHQLMGAVLCFPAGWTLAEKIGRPLTAIHGPVAAYDATMARRVQRLFDAIRPGQPLWRANLLHYDDPALFAPASEAAPRRPPGPDAPYLRSERQCLLRLPQSGAVVFSIHTWLLRRSVGAGS